MSKRRPTFETIEAAVYSALHERIGYCGHCGKRDCAGRVSYSQLPDSIPFSALREAFYVAGHAERARSAKASEAQQAQERA